jgi:hypothetical protein
VNLIGWNFNRRRLPERLSAEHRRPAPGQPALVHRAGLETTLFAALTAVIGTLALCGFPQPYHPNNEVLCERGSPTAVPRVGRGSEVRPGRTRDLLQLGARGVTSALHRAGIDGRGDAGGAPAPPAAARTCTTGPQSRSSSDIFPDKQSRVRSSRDRPRGFSDDAFYTGMQAGAPVERSGCR